jgi:hypothetical protein
MPDPAQPSSLVANKGNSGFFRAELVLPAGSANASEIARSVRDFAFSSNPQLNPATQFDIRIEPVRGLWEALQTQVVDVRYLGDGQEFNRFACVLHNGSVKTLGVSFGGYGLMSGLMQVQNVASVAEEELVN